MKNQDNFDEKLPQEEVASHSHKKEKNKKTKLIILIVACVLVFAVIATVIFGVFYIKGILNFNFNEISKNPEDLGFEEVKSDDIENIALFGVDTHDNESFEGRSDSIIILSVNKTDKKIKLVSVLRDSFVPIVENGKTRYHILNNAYFTGGPELAIKTLNTVYDLDISEYATVNFYGVLKIVDSIGGIEIDITPKELEMINSSVKAYCERSDLSFRDYELKKSGKQMVEGIHIMAYTRIRMIPNADGTKYDYGRTDRQRYVLEQIFNKAVKLDIPQIVELIKTLTPFCETSLSYTEMLGLAASVLLDSPTFEDTRVPFTEYVMDDPKNNIGDVVYYDLDFAAKLIHSYIYEDITPEKYIEQYGIEQKDWYADIIREN